MLGRQESSGRTLPEVVALISYLAHSLTAGCQSRKFCECQVRQDMPRKNSLELGRCQQALDLVRSCRCTPTPVWAQKNLGIDQLLVQAQLAVREQDHVGLLDVSRLQSCSV